MNRCTIFRATNWAWYLEVVNESGTKTIFGPFASGGTAEQYLRRMMDTPSVAYEVSNTRQPPEDAVYPY